MNKRETARRDLNEFKKYSSELKDFSFLIFGSALTITRDGFHDDDDIDFAVYQKDVKKLFTFLKKNNLNIKRLFTFEGKISEVTIKFRNTLIDFFILDDFLSNGSQSYVFYKEWNFFSHKITEIIVTKTKISKSTKFCNKDEWKVICDPKWFKYKYGENWKIKTLPNQYTKQVKSLISERTKTNDSIFLNKKESGIKGKMFLNKKAKLYIDNKEEKSKS